VKTRGELLGGDFKTVMRDRLTPCDAVTQHHLWGLWCFAESVAASEERMEWDA
jgi:hypothetical protein